MNFTFTSNFTYNPGLKIKKKVHNSNLNKLYYDESINWEIGKFGIQTKENLKKKQIKHEHEINNRKRKEKMVNE